MSNRNSKIIPFIIVIIACIALTFILTLKRSEAPVVQEQTTEENPSIGLLSDMIIIDTPVIGDILSDGKVMLSGKARGNWYFEASAPVELRDENNKLIATSYVTAQGEWMTTDFVPFKGQITYTLPQGMKNGFVVFKNDNASGEPERDKSVSIPVKFK